MTTHFETMKRREDVSLCLQKGLYSKRQIAENLRKKYKIPDEEAEVKKWSRTIDNDLRWFRKEATPWLKGYALDGYVYETKNVIEGMRDIEIELQKMRQEESDSMKKVKILETLVNTMNIRWVIQGEGPTLMNLRMSKYEGYSKETKQSLR